MRQLEEYSELAPHEAESRTGKGQELDFFSVFFQLLPRCGTSLQVVLLKRLNGTRSWARACSALCGGSANGSHSTPQLAQTWCRSQTG